MRRVPPWVVSIYMTLIPSTTVRAVGLVIDQAYRQKGYATIALELIEAFAFDQLQLHQLYAGVGEDNPASIRFLSRQGYEQMRTKKRLEFLQ